PCPRRDVGQPAPLAADQQLRGHCVGNVRAVVADVPVGRYQVEPSVVVGVQEGDPEAQEVAAGRGQADPGRPVGEEAGAEVVIQAGGFAEEVGDGQVGPAVAVEVAAGHAHARLVTTRRVGRDRRDLADL